MWCVGLRLHDGYDWYTATVRVRVRRLPVRAHTQLAAGTRAKHDARVKVDPPHDACLETPTCHSFDFMPLGLQLIECHDILLFPCERFRQILRILGMIFDIILAF